VIVVDSSGWIEFFTDGQLADDYAARLRNLAVVVTPVIVLYEVYKRLKRELTEDDAVVAVSVMQRTQVVAVDQELAMADALVLATARRFHADLITSDRDFKNLPGVVYLPKKSYS
jgi:predicted nucleic acid-binding protein